MLVAGIRTRGGLVTLEGGFLLPAPRFEPPVRPCPPRPPIERASATSPSRCRNRMDGARAAAKAVSRTGSAGLQRVLRSSHAVKNRESDECNTAATQFAGKVLRLTLEVLDGRRPPVQLVAVADPAVVAAVRTLAGARRLPGRGLGSATLTRVDVIMADPGTAEVCAAYDRGPRHFALAARIVRGRSGWRLAAFRVC
ncbi:Rv3235 family protein [Nocardia sp. CDC160]|uniref:Rv3235 family protein n=1 Tax=Nocardia sp. CDC160 TaxID=3112166 RepID=UPI002DBD8E89|nr:Rv3235 family protein [Nocardia sp. CDC160]MEC3920601.1 Rv3235 family protein [Nocardia sp. CDC160]